MFCFFLPFPFLEFSPSRLCPASSAGAGHPPLPVSLPLLPRWTPPVLDASCRPMGELHAAPVRRLPAVSPHRSGPRGSELQLPWDGANAWEAVPSGAAGGERRTVDRQQLRRSDGSVRRRNTRERRNTFHARRHVTCRLCSSRAGAPPPHTALGRDLAQRHVEPRPLRVTRRLLPDHSPRYGRPASFVSPQTFAVALIASCVSQVTSPWTPGRWSQT